MAIIEELTEKNEEKIKEEISHKASSSQASSVAKNTPITVLDTSLKSPNFKTSNTEHVIKWGQTEKLVMIEVHIPGLSYNQIKVTYDDKSFSLTIKDPKYTLEIQLSSPIVKNFCMYKCLPEYFDVKLKKDLNRTSKRNMTWPSLYKDGPCQIKETDNAAVLPSKTEKNESKTEKKTNENTSGQMPTPKISHDWYQTDQFVIVEVRIKGLKHEQVKVEFSTAALSVSAKLPVSSASNGSEYSLELDLANEVLPEESIYKVLSTKLEIKMKKKDWIRWSALEGNGSLDVLNKAPDAAANEKKTEEKPKSTAAKKGPKDWNNINKFLDSELEYLKDNQDAGDVFSMLYKDASDDTKKAMNKSMQESGGTVLSMDWKDIGSRTVHRYKDKDEK